MMKTIKKKYTDAAVTVKEKLGLKNDLAMPRIVKVVINSGTGQAKDKKHNDLVADRLAKITGQKPTARPAKKSIATFKTRQGEIIGLAVTLRGKRLDDFLNKLINIALPRSRDFKGFDDRVIDAMGNLTIGLREHIIFPETADEELKDVFGLSVTVVTTAKNKAEAKTLFEAIGFPFKK